MSVIGLPVFSIFLSIKFHLDIPLSLFLFNILVIIDSIIFQAIAFGLAGKIHSISEVTIDNWRRVGIVDKKSKAIAFKTLRSLQTIKIKFGSANFLEKNTCLSIIQFTLTSVANMLLTWKE
jgi:hypothetical protein